MSNKIKSGICKDCDKKVKVEKGRPNHILHIILVFCTGGLWFPIWILSCMTGEWRCFECGSNKLKKVR